MPRLECGRCATTEGNAKAVWTRLLFHCLPTNSSKWPLWTCVTMLIVQLLSFLWSNLPCNVRYSSCLYSQTLVSLAMPYWHWLRVDVNVAWIRISQLCLATHAFITRQTSYLLRFHYIWESDATFCLVTNWTYRLHGYHVDMLIQIDNFLPMDHKKECGHGFQNWCKDIGWWSPHRI